MNGSVQQQQGVFRAGNIPLFLKFAAVSLLTLFLYYPALSSMVNAWYVDKEYSHGFLIPFISGYLIWAKRAVIRSAPLLPDFRGYFIVLLGIAMLVLGSIAFEPFTTRVSLLITVLGLVTLLLGKHQLKVLLFPIAYLAFMIPPPYIVMKGIAVGLKLFNATVTSRVLTLLGIPVLQEGANLELPNMNLVVADFCTGILSLIAIMAIAVLYAYLTQKSFLSRAALIVLAVPIAILGNTVRLITTVGLAYFYGGIVLQSAIHEFHGTVNFLFTILFLALAGKFIRRIDEKVTGSVPS